MSSSSSDDDSSFFPLVPFAVGVFGTVAALRGAALASSSDELSSELLLSLALAAGVDLAVAAGVEAFTGVLLATASSSSELFSLDEDSAAFAVAGAVLGVAVLPFVAAGFAGVVVSFSESELSEESEELSLALEAAVGAALVAAGLGADATFLGSSSSLELSSLDSAAALGAEVAAGFLAAAGF